MFNRLETDQVGKDLPAQWCQQTEQLLTENFKDYCEQKNRYFDIFGRIYSQEITLVFSLLHQIELQLAPISLFISIDLAQEKQPQDRLDDMTALAGLIFDGIFQEEDWNDYHSRWLETNYKDRCYYYKITRENIRLSIEADELLKGQSH